MSRVTIVGSGGRLGAALAREWSAVGEEILAFPRASLDLSSADGIRRALAPVDCDVLVNCAALTNVDYCETHEDEAMRVNRDAVRTLGEWCESRGVRCVHISTDYVFDGEKRLPYVEQDEAKPLGVYAASKLAGETELAGACADSLSVRVSWVFGPDRPSFIDQILTRAHETEELSAIADKWAAPTYTLDAAKLLRPLLRKDQVRGVIHLTNAGECTWQEYGQYALDCAVKLGAPLKGRIVAPIAMRDLKAFIAKRPVYTVLSSAKLTACTQLTPRPWQEAVEAHIRTRVAGGVRL